MILARSTLRAQLVLALFFFNDTATTEIYTLSLHDALPISEFAGAKPGGVRRFAGDPKLQSPPNRRTPPDRESTRLNSSHVRISYAVFCLKKKKSSIIRLSRVGI